MSRVASNAFWLVLAQVGGMCIPLVELPVLARALGQHAYGRILYAMGIALTASVFVEFGFNFSAARSLVRVRDDAAALAQLVTNVLAAKLFLGIIVALAVAAVLACGSGDAALPGQWYVWIGLLILVFGFSPLWYYIGTEDLVLPALLDVGLRTAGLLCIIALVSAPEHARRVLIIQSTVGLANTGIPTLILLRRAGAGPFSLSGTWLVLRESWELFLFKGAQSIMGSIASTLLGFFGGARVVGAFVPAEKLVRAATGLVSLALNAAFPHLVRVQAASGAAAKRLVGISLLAVGGLTILFALLTVWLAPVVVSLVFGPGYESAIALLRILVWIVPLRVSSMIMAVLWFIPAGREDLASRAMLVNLILVCLLASLLVPSRGGLGMTLTFLCSEVTMFAVLMILFCRKSA
ncbi:MAG: oligosaccharide flippase family protein [Desulfocapsaceae bacterium]|nr:oligosaccharide flippase family protein [Desulfocapsaceae bacterium]